MQGGITIADAITGLAGAGVSSGALVNVSGSNTLSGNVTMTADSTVTATAGKDAASYYMQVTLSRQLDEN